MWKGVVGSVLHFSSSFSTDKVLVLEPVSTSVLLIILSGTFTINELVLVPAKLAPCQHFQPADVELRQTGNWDGKREEWCCHKSKKTDKQKNLCILQIISNPLQTTGA